MIKDDLLYVTDFAGLLHGLNAKTGRVYWNHDLFAAGWGSPLLVDDKVYTPSGQKRPMRNVAEFARIQPVH